MVKDTIWEEICKTIRNSQNEIKICPIEHSNSIDFHKIRDPYLSSIINNSSGIRINKWIHLLGHDSNGTKGFDFFNNTFSNLGVIIIAYDLIGGLFAINTEMLRTGKNHILYFAPDKLEWEDLEFDYLNFLNWCFNGDISVFYDFMKCDEIINLVSNISENEMILIYPFLWSKEFNLTTSLKKIVPCEELIKLNFDFCEKINNSGNNENTDNVYKQ